MKKKLMIALSYVLILALGIAGTIAFLTGEDEVVNTFELDDNVSITLDEAPVEKVGDLYQETTGTRVKANTYKDVYPGAVMPKDPTVHLANANTADAYLKVTVTVPNAKAWLGTTEADLNTLTGNTVDAKWQFSKGELVGEDVVYTLFYADRMVAGASTEPVFEQIVFPAEFDTAEIRTYFGTAAPQFNVEVNAYSIQAAGFTSAVQAFGVKEGTMDLWDGEVNEELDTTAATVEVATAEDLAAIAAAVNGGDELSGQTIKLTKDIDLSGIEWTPIGQTGGYYAADYFQGTFDGQGHTIYNLTINNTNTGENYAAGFFGFLDCGQTGAIKNLNFDNATVKGHHWTGVVAGYTSGTIENCNVTNSAVECTHADDNACGDKAGGITGYINGTQGKVVNCSVENTAVTAGRDGGAVVGAAYPAQVTGCSFDNVTVTASAGCTGENLNEAVIGRVL